VSQKALMDTGTIVVKIKLPGLPALQ